MIGYRVTTIDRLSRVRKAVDTTAFHNLGHAAASIRKSAAKSIKRAPKEQRTGSKTRKGKKVRRARHAASRPGSPPYTLKGLLSKSIRFDVDKGKKRAIIGPRFSLVGLSGRAHELGGRYKGQQYPKRPFMYPALVKSKSRFIGRWSGRLGS